MQSGLTPVQKSYSTVCRAERRAGGGANAPADTYLARCPSHRCLPLQSEEETIS